MALSIAILTFILGMVILTNIAYWFTHAINATNTISVTTAQST